MTDDKPAKWTDEADPELLAAVSAAQRVMCRGRNVDKALRLRYEAAAEHLPQIVRTAGNTDPRVVAIEAPYRAAQTSDAPAPAKATGSRRANTKQRS